MHHAAVATELLACGIDLLIEKPLAATLEQADAILDAARADAPRGRELIVQPGHLERFNPAVRAARELITRPMFFEVHRLSVFTPRSLDVDVVLDLMIHDLDVVMSLVRSPVREVRAVGLPVLSPRVDIANVRIEFENGCIANFTASRVSTERVRKMRFFQPHQYRLAGLRSPGPAPDRRRRRCRPGPRHRLPSRHRADAAARRSAPIRRASRCASSPSHPASPCVWRSSRSWTAVRTRHQPEVTGNEGRAALALALEINAAIASHTARTGL